MDDTFDDDFPKQHYSLVRNADLMMPLKSGAYQVFTDDQVLYVGSSRNLKERWRAHHIALRLLEWPDAQIMWVEVDDYIDTENQWIKWLHPLLNKRRAA